MRPNLRIKPVAWSYVAPNPAIQIFGYTDNNKTVYLRFPAKSTYFVEFSVNEPDDEAIENLSVLTDSNDIVFDPIGYNNVVKVRAFTELPGSSVEILNSIGFKKDPYGIITSFLEHKKIGPYDWLEINSYQPLFDKNYTMASLNISTTEEAIHPITNKNILYNLPIIEEKLMFFDIETYSSRPGEFTNSSVPDDRIFMISILISYKGEVENYILSTEKVLERAIQNKEANVEIFNAEVDLIRMFYSIIDTTNPDKLISYNGYSYDIPYIIKRSRLLKIELPKFSKIRSFQPYIRMIKINSIFGEERVEDIILPGLEKIDLVDYYRKTNPYYPNYKLDSIANAILGQGKTGLPISRMMEIVKNKDSVSMAKVVDYSYIDSLRLLQLYKQDQIAEMLEELTSNLAVTNETFLRESFKDILEKTIYNIDPFWVYRTSDIDIKRPRTYIPTPGFYSQLFVYDYTNLYLEIMQTSSNELVNELGRRLEGSPPGLILEAFYSRFVYSDELYNIFKGELEKHLSDRNIVAIYPTKVFSIQEIDDPNFRIVNEYLEYLAVSDHSYISMHPDESIESVGMANLCRPPCKIIKDLIESYFRKIYEQKYDSVEFEIDETDISKLTLTENVGPLATLDQDSLKYSLALQLDDDIHTSAKIEYVQTTNGPVVLNKLQVSDKINKDFYTKLADNAIKKLRSYPMFQRQ